MLLRSMCTLPGPETCKSEWRGWGRRGRRTKDTRRLPFACGLFNTNHVAVRRATRLHYGAAHKHANTQRAEWTQTRKRREYTHSRAHTAALIRRLVIIISERGREGVWGGEEKKKADGFEAAGADRRDEAYWHLHRKGCARSPTGFIMTGPCEGGPESCSEFRSRYSRKTVNKISAFIGVATKEQDFFRD